MTGKLAVITGANRGFGCAIAQSIAAHADQDVTTFIVLMGRNEQELQEVATKCQRPHVNVRIISNVCMDSAEKTEQTCLAPLTEMIKDKVWSSAVLINNAGSSGDVSKTTGEYSTNEISSYIQFNIVSYVVLVNGFLALFRSISSNAQVRIVNISSLLAVQAFSHWGLYATGKAARDMLLSVVSKEHMSDTVRTLSYAPGPLDNDMQKYIRNALGDETQKRLYSDLANKNELVPMGKSAEKLVLLLEQDTYESGSHIDFYDL